MALSNDLLSILRCPESKQPLVYFNQAGSSGGSGSFLFCPSSRLKFRVDDGIPVMLVDEAERVSEAEATRLVAEARRLGLAGV
jgi:uncharacterized protein YbaR (Trm112 family)